MEGKNELRRLFLTHVVLMPYSDKGKIGSLSTPILLLIRPKK
ncbi:hypothetical protein HNQ92_004831 [Rhabdobacter roseus]|uniref:Uncharacterized protein n=1 Tax=Rhabdobacter roseus TaxID=1655419 RepID=A0A840U3H9_9BACT|nr:hypothetical protein [Rhabdobacter roseus]MBB5286670.1 hypothetical protein [Rhabdobacter roseus]